jgi:hypothetical protein
VLEQGECTPKSLCFGRPMQCSKRCCEKDGVPCCAGARQGNAVGCVHCGLVALTTHAEKGHPAQQKGSYKDRYRTSAKNESTCGRYKWGLTVEREWTCGAYPDAMGYLRGLYRVTERVGRVICLLRFVHKKKEVEEVRLSSHTCGRCRGMCRDGWSSCLSLEHHARVGRLQI